MSLGNRLKEIRKMLGKSQKEMAMLINVSFRAWQGYEAGGDVWPALSGDRPEPSKQRAC